MSNLIPANSPVPAHLIAAGPSALAAAAAGGIKTGGVTRIGIKGSKFHLSKDGEQSLIEDPLRPGAGVPLMVLDVVVVGANPGLSKLYYESGGGQNDGEFEAGSQPDCASENGKNPDNGVGPDPANPSPHCALCPKNAWGSAKSKTTGKDVKACRDLKNLVILPAYDLESLNAHEPVQFTVTPTALADWSKYIKALKQRQLSPEMVVTSLKFDSTAAYPKVVFEFTRYLSEEEYAVVTRRLVDDSDDIEAVAMPRGLDAIPAAAAHDPVPAHLKAKPTAPAVVAPSVDPATGAPLSPEREASLAAHRATVTAAAEAAQAGASSQTAADPETAAKAAPAASGKPRTRKPAPAAAPAGVPPAADDPFAGLPAHVKPAVDAAGGLDNVQGRQVLLALGGKLPVPKRAPVEADPFEGLPAHVKPAVEAAGGLGSPGGDSVFAALSGKPAAPPAPKLVDPFEGLPAYVKTAVESAGGLGSAAGDAVFQQLAAANKPAAVPPTPVVTPKPVPAPAPTGQVTDLDAILAAAMG